MSKNWFKAFAAGKSCNSTRIPIDAERIVVVLGEDAAGRSLEVSISLEQRAAQPGELFVYANQETEHGLPITHLAELIICKHSTTMNTGGLHVRIR